MIGYVRSPRQWAYVRVTGALAAAALHSPLFTTVSCFCNLPTAASTVHGATVPPLNGSDPCRTSNHINANSKQQKKSCSGPGGQEKLGCRLYPGYIKIENAAKKANITNEILCADDYIMIPPVWLEANMCKCVGILFTVRRL